MKSKNIKNNKKGFTLIELLVAVVIIGVLATIGTVQYIRSAEKSKLSEALMVMNSVAKTEQHHYFAKDKYTKRFADLSLDFVDKTGAMAQNDKMDTNNYKMTLENNRVRSERITGDYTLFEYYGDEKITCTPKEHFICENYPEETNTSGESTEEPESEPQRNLEPYCSKYGYGQCEAIREYNEDGGYTEKEGCASMVDNICVKPMMESTYDKDGNMVESSDCYGYDGDVCGYEMKYKREYDANGNKTSEKYYDSSGALSSEYKYEYDENGNMTSQKNYDSSGALSGEIKYEYDANGNQTSQKYYNSSGFYSSRNYTYDENGNQTSQTYCPSSGSCFVNYEYTYDANGNRTSQKIYNSPGVLYEEYKLEYDANGNRTSIKYYLSSGALRGEAKYEYDANGNMTSDKYYNSSGALERITEYSKDENGNPVEKFCSGSSLDKVNGKCL